MKPARLKSLICHTIPLLLYFFLFSPTFTPAQDAIIEPITLPPLPDQKVVLTLHTPTGDKPYTLAQIEALGMKRMSTSTYWAEDDGSTYEGVLLKDLLKDAGMEKSPVITLIALDDYTAYIPKEDWETWPVLVATRRDGKPMSIRKKGPTRIIYPKDMGGPVAKTEQRIKWIWTLKTISPKD